jgi:hypothetical protein
MTARGNALSVALGPGYLYLAVLGTSEPTDLSTAWDAAWKPLGYTDAGSTQSYAPAYDNVEVAEELDPIDSVATGREIKVSFSLAENTALNYQRAMNGGTITVTGTSPDQIFAFEPPDLGDETQVMLGFESEQHDERWVWRQCKQTGTVQTDRKKGADKALIPMEFSVYKPAAAKPFIRLSTRAGEAAS